MASKNHLLSSEEWVRDNAEMGELSEMESESVELDYVRPEFYEDEWAI